MKLYDDSASLQAIWEWRDAFDERFRFNQNQAIRKRKQLKFVIDDFLKLFC